MNKIANSILISQKLGFKIGAVSGGIIGGGTGLYTTWPRHKIQNFDEKVSWSVVAFGFTGIGCVGGAIEGALIGGTWPISIPVIMYKWIEYKFFE